MENDINGSSGKEIDLQRTYYRNTADKYDAMHMEGDGEHDFALGFLNEILDFYNITSLLDIGAGTGRAARYLKERHPLLRMVSVEPVAELREIGYTHGLSRQELVDGDVNRLAYGDGEFDMVCEFGVLHHVKTPRIAVKEMLRVGKKGIFLSDSNNFGHGSSCSRVVKQMIDSLGLWKVADFIKTRGRGYRLSEGDGLSYSYSVFNNYRQIAAECETYILNTSPAGVSSYRSASHVALLGIKKGLK
jgi:ubiquinone/menaquinone biosynthesis C-methylase UbiE